MEKGTTRRVILGTVLGVLVILIALPAYLILREELLTSLPVYGELPEFSLTDSRGRTITRESLRGRVWVADLIYTRCQDTCPLQTAEMRKLHKNFAGAKDFRQVSVSTDPDHDTSEVLAKYAASFGADPGRWHFLTGKKETIARLARKGFRLSYAVKSAHRGWGKGEVLKNLTARLASWLAPRPAFAHHPRHGGKNTTPGILISHSLRFVLLDRNAKIRGYYLSNDGKSLKKLNRDLKSLLAR